MEILTSAEMSATDRRTAEEFGVPLTELMENAGGAVAGFCLRQYAAAERVLVLCGKGNNGGDGLVAARMLAVAGVEVEVLLLGREDEVKGEAAVALRRLRVEAPEVGVREVLDEAGLAAANGAMERAELVIDAVVGTGFKPPLRGLAVGLRELVAQASAAVVAVDLPSGWDADSMEQRAEGAFRADAVVTFTRPKMAHVFGNLTGQFGPVVVAEIGSPERHVGGDSDGGLTWAGAAKAIAERARDVNSNKECMGTCWWRPGATGRRGRRRWRAWRRCGGCGAGDSGGAEEHCGRGRGSCAGVDDGGAGAGAEGAILLENLAGGWMSADQEKRISVAALGPGLSTGARRGVCAGFMARVKLPIVVDADALNAFDGRAAELLEWEGASAGADAASGRDGAAGGDDGERG